MIPPENPDHETRGFKKLIVNQDLLIKTAAKKIFLGVNKGEPVMTTTVHLSEVANVLEDTGRIGFACDLLAAVMATSSIDVRPVSADDFQDSIQQA